MKSGRSDSKVETDGVHQRRREDPNLFCLATRDNSEIGMAFKTGSTTQDESTIGMENSALLHHRSEIEMVDVQEQRSEIEPTPNRTREEIISTWVRNPHNKTRNNSETANLAHFTANKKRITCCILSLLTLFSIFGLPWIIRLSMHDRNPQEQPMTTDKYAKALKQALMFFNAQKSGKLPNDNGVKWRGDSGLKDGMDAQQDLVGGYYDHGNNIKFHFPMAFSMTLLSWSVIEYNHKYKAIEEYEHVKNIIRWGTDYLLKTFDSNATDINIIYSQVGIASNKSIASDDYHYWTRPEDMDYPRPTLISLSGPELGAEIAAALAAASIVFKEDTTYSIKLLKGASTVYNFARRNRIPYCSNTVDDIQFYNSTGYWDEYVWSAAWMYYATGDKSYMMFGTNVKLSKNAQVYKRDPNKLVFNWDNKLPVAILIWTRLRILMNPGYPYEESLKVYHDTVQLNMCSYMKQYKIFNWTKAGLIQLKHGHLQTLQYVVNAAFLANLYSDYMAAIDVPGFYCGNDYFDSMVLRSFASSQLNYIMGRNPKNMSYIVGFGKKFPRQVHHRGASIPRDGVKYSCKSGILKWRDINDSNPNIIVGAMVGGLDSSDDFMDIRARQDYTEPTLAGNAGLVASLISLTDVGGKGIDKNSMFSAIPSYFPTSPPPPQPWRP